MGFMEFFRGNDGFDKQAIPPNGPGETSEEEAKVAEGNRLRKEALEAKIVEIEGNPNHSDYDQLETMRTELRSLMEPFQ